MTEESKKQFAYDEVPYPIMALPMLSPSKLGMVALTRGWAAPPPETASFLEIGGGMGVNAIAVAAAYPETRCVSFDLSAHATRLGQSMVEAAGLTNVAIEQGDIMTYPRDGEKFDYIACHGVFTWVPEPVRAGLLELIRARLAPGGIAYVGYDALPASSVKQSLNRFFRSQVSHIEDIPDRVDAAINLAAVLLQNQQEHSRFAAVLKQLVDDAPHYQRSYVYHDWLAEFYSPQSLFDLAKGAARFGLAFGGDAGLNDIYTGDMNTLGQELVAAAGDDLVERNVVMDMLRGTHSFRQDILVHGDAPPPEMSNAWRQLYYSFDGKREEAVVDGEAGIKYSKGELFMHVPEPDVQKVFDCVHNAYPNEISYDDILAQSGMDQRRLDHLLDRGVGMRTLERHAARPAHVGTPGERPVAGALVRAMLAHENAAITLRHKRVTIPEPGLRLMLCLCNGTRTREEIAKIVSSEFDTPVTTQDIENGISHFARHCLFVA